MPAQVWRSVLVDRPMAARRSGYGAARSPVRDSRNGRPGAESYSRRRSRGPFPLAQVEGQPRECAPRVRQAPGPTPVEASAGMVETDPGEDADRSADRAE